MGLVVHMYKPDHAHCTLSQTINRLSDIVGRPVGVPMSWNRTRTSTRVPELFFYNSPLHIHIMFFSSMCLLLRITQWQPEQGKPTSYSETFHND